MDEITIGDKTYISSKQAAKITGYAKDYVGQLCREGRVEARLVGRNWYVLDSAIREHRFGKDGEEQDASVKEVSEPAEEAISTWQQPQYVAEAPAFVPPLAPKQASAAETPAIADMQSAWKEWFEEKKPAFEPVSDEVADSTEEYLPFALPEEPAEDAKEEEVVISRIESEPLAAEEPEEEISLHRSYASFATGERVPETTVPVIDLSAPRPSEARRLARRAPTKDYRGAGVARALMLVLAVTAGIVALVGTGNADRLLSGTSLDFGAQKAIVDYLGGKSTYESSL